jgi:dihydrofolate reductase
MAKLRIHCFSMSLDGFSAGPNQDANNPLGVGGTALHQWFYPTRGFQKMHGKDDGTTGVDNDFAEQGMAGIGACILGRNMFGPIRGAWPNDKWRGWWEDNPPFHTPVFVLSEQETCYACSVGQFLGRIEAVRRNCGDAMGFEPTLLATNQLR